MLGLVDDDNAIGDGAIGSLSIHIKVIIQQSAVRSDGLDLDGGFFGGAEAGHAAAKRVDADAGIGLQLAHQQYGIVGVAFLVAHDSTKGKELAQRYIVRPK